MTTCRSDGEGLRKEALWASTVWFVASGMCVRRGEVHSPVLHGSTGRYVMTAMLEEAHVRFVCVVTYSGQYWHWSRTKTERTMAWGFMPPSLRVYEFISLGSR